MDDRSQEKDKVKYDAAQSSTAAEGDVTQDPTQDYNLLLKQSLKSRHLQMMAIGVSGHCPCPAQALLLVFPRS